MTDKELLELAAKAAGLLVGPNWTEFDWDVYGWDPLANDSDALRLAVKLGIHLQFAMDFAVAYAGSVHSKQFTERCGSDQYAATRRAIVRAAAEIGKAIL